MRAWIGRGTWTESGAERRSIASPSVASLSILRAITPRTSFARASCSSPPPLPRPADESRLLHDHGGAVPFVAGRQRAADLRHRTAAGNGRRELDDADAEAVLRHLVRRPCRFRRRVCRFLPEGPGNAGHQHDQDRRLPSDVLRRSPADRLCGCGVRCGRLFAGKVRHRDRAAAAGKTRCRQRLDRRSDGHLDHPRLPARRRSDQSKYLSVVAGA